MGLSPKRNKSLYIQSISDAFKEYEDYKKEKIDKYTRIEQLGLKGKEGTTYLVKDKKGKEYAMKTFRKTKSSAKLEKEVELQEKMAKLGVAPKIIDYDVVSKYIVMEKMDKHLFQGKYTLTKEQQKNIYEIFEKLDKGEVLHNDVNPLNFMIKKEKIYLIDYGLAKNIDDKLKKKLKTDIPNTKLMTIGFILKLKELKAEPKSYKYLLQNVSQEDKKNYSL